jgi:beta-lactam-binding protein with PASTA domain
MPDLIGDDLDDAEAALTALGAERVKTVDANGDGRSQIMTSNWKVCSQDPRQGKDTDGDRKITLGVVKQSERCP